jgi:hypothetical protein
MVKDDVMRSAVNFRPPFGDTLLFPTTVLDATVK